jgi:hypothetical protein
MAEASFDFQMADRQIRQIVTRSQLPRISLWYVVLARALEGIQSPVGEETEISLP